MPTNSLNQISNFSVYSAIQNITTQASILANASKGEAEAGGSQPRGQPQKLNKALSQNLK